MDCFKNLFKPATPAVVIPIETVTDVVKPSGKYSLMIDVSHYEPIPSDYKQLILSGVRAVYVKASEHAMDSLLHAHIKAAQAAGLPCGAYHFLHCSGDPSAQAKMFLDSVKDLKLELRHCLDWEGGSADGQSNAHQFAIAQSWLDIVEKASGHIPCVYSGYSFAKDLKLPVSFAKYPLWLARYTSNAITDTPAPWKQYAAWQYTDALKLNGLAGGHSVDASRADLSALLI